MRYLIKTRELEEKINYLKKQLDIISESILNIEKEKKLLSWRGVASESFIKKCDKHILELKKIEKSTIACIDFFVGYYDKYNQQYNDFKIKYSRNLNMEIKDEFSSL